MKRITIFDFLIWIIFILWCIVNSPKPYRHLDAIFKAADSLKTTDIIWNVASDLLPLVVAFSLSVLAVRVLRWLNRRIH